MYELKSNILPTTADQKGDWKPIVFLFTDGVPTDSPSDLQAVITEWKQKWSRSANMVIVSFGDATDATILAELTDNVLYFDNADLEAYKTFFKWVTASIKSSSMSVMNNAAGFELATFNDAIAKIDLANLSREPAVDDNFVVLSAKCQNTKQPYLIKYRKNVFEVENGDIMMNYKLVGAFKVDNSYFEMSDENAGDLKISADILDGSPTCPCCGNQFGFGYDPTCGKIYCLEIQGLNTCPWCGAQGETSLGESGFDVNRTRG